ncbi:MAG: MT-A70 family methyltransferase [Lachnospiraceae bacterium]|nr:MT-A70 family methyltransferase [Muribaculaceae bacterium]MCM1411064.1 MT-A70 family methyltransferase [Lachnospiraceae bacterium]
MVFDAEKINAMKISEPLLPASLKDGAGAIIIDPAWPVEQKGNYGAIKHYKLMTLEQIKALPVASLCAENAHCWLWVTNATMEVGFSILRAWGFTPRSIFTWLKPRLGLGVYLRNCTEHCILATRGKAPVRVKNQPNIGIFPIQDHSHKPEEFYDIVERVSPGPYLELFARRPRHGWSSWGNEIGSDVVIPGYPVPRYSGAILPARPDSKKKKEDKKE